MITYQTELTDITTDQLIGFFVGWPNPPSPETHLKLLKNSSKAIIAIDEETGHVIGFITAISDGVLSAYIPFLEVLPDYQGEGIGKELVTRLFAELRDIYMVDLSCDEDLVSFYKKLGMHQSNAMVFRNYDRQSGGSL